MSPIKIELQLSFGFSRKIFLQLNRSPKDDEERYGRLVRLAVGMGGSDRAGLAAPVVERFCKVHGCQMAIAGFLDRMFLALWASELWLRYATLQNLIPSFP